MLLIAVLSCVTLKYAKVEKYKLFLLIHCAQANLLTSYSAIYNNISWASCSEQTEHEVCMVPLNTTEKD